RGALRSGAPDEDISTMIASVWRARDDRYSELRTAEISERQKIEMSYIGG
ncbi:MAG: GTP 3',8-cyclase MoaA, partial [Planctomycetes bacterium]|nr:GTP 3',8-cyclase MoaA [Planctomycetota bacterium]